MGKIERFLKCMATAILLCIMAALPARLHAQYAEDMFNLHAAQEQYDERGFTQGKSISVDGKLVVSNANGVVSYSYPISSYKMGGYPFDVSLNYCGSVDFTTFKSYKVSDVLGPVYSGWSRFNQNRPAWIFGINGFALNVISTASELHAQPGSRIFNPGVTSFNDHDFIWTIDGYDFCNRMRDPGADDHTGYYWDEIHLLRSDGSVLKLGHLTSKLGGILHESDKRPEIYTGYYYPNEANNHAFGIVKYDSIYWTESIQGPMKSYCADTGRRAPLVPRVLYYYPGDGLQYTFREWLAPYGMGPLWYDDSLTGTIYGGASIFYLEEIRSNAGQIMTFNRTRHYPYIARGLDPVWQDSTRGRAIITSFAGHDISFGYNSMTIEALGRTTTVRFNTVARSGNADSWETMPYANNGSVTPASLEMANWSENNSALYKSFVGYVTEIVDPEGRVTSFDYQPYTRVYQNFSFPNGASGTPTITLQNYRLKSVTEPDVKYNLYYHGSTNETIDQHSTPWLGYKLDNMIDSVVKADLGGTRLTKDDYIFPAYGGGYTATQVQTKDCISGAVKTSTFAYASYTLENVMPGVPPAKQTTLVNATASTADQQTSTATSYTTSYTTPSGGSVSLGYLRLPSSETQGQGQQQKSFTTYSYVVDSLRAFFNDSAMIRRCGWEVVKKVVQYHDPSNHARILRTDTIDYYNRNPLDTTMTWMEHRWDKLATYRNYFYMKDTLQDSLVLNSDPEKILYWPPVGVFVDTAITYRITVPSQYGTELRHVSYDENGVLIQGTKNVFLTNIKRGDYTEFLGALLADSVIGRGGTHTLLNNTYTYSEGWGTSFPNQVVNAVGSTVLHSSSPWFCWNDGSHQWDTCFTNNLPLMSTIANDGTVKTQAFYGNSMSGWYGSPLGDAQMVRRYDGSGNLVNRLLFNFKEQSFFGNVSGVLDANGWYSKFDYDYNGRLLRAWLPHDFPLDTVNVADTTYYPSVEDLGFAGNTYYSRRVDTLWCYTDPEGIDHSKVLTGSVSTAWYEDTLMASVPVTAEPDCARPTIRDPRAKRRDGQGGALQRTFVDKIPFDEVINCPTCEGYVGRLDHFVGGASPLASVVSIDSANLQLYISVSDTKCTQVEIACPQLSLSRTYVLNCPSVTPVVAAAKKGDDGGVLSVAPAPKPIQIKIDLTSYKSQLLALTKNSLLTFTIKTTTPGATVDFVQGLNGADTRPRLVVGGKFRRIRNLGGDYTLAYSYDDANLNSTVKAKIDDRNHTSSRYGSYLATKNNRLTSATHQFGAEGRLLNSQIDFVKADGSVRTDEISSTYDGLGHRLATTDQESDVTTTHYDTWGRPAKVDNADGTFTTVAYKDSTAAYFGVSDQDFYGFCEARVSTDEKGIKNVQYTDAFDRLRREVIDSGSAATHLNLTTRYDYDVFGRLNRVINPKGDTSKYWYDEFGRVRYKYQSDLGTISYAYDKVGNVRFTQSEREARASVVGFNQFDDLKRLTVVGEATIAYEALPDSLPPTGTSPNLNRLTDRLDPNFLHDSLSVCLTASKSLWTNPAVSVPTIWGGAALDSSSCTLSADTLLGESTAPVGDFMRHTVQYYDPTSVSARAGIFEHLAQYPDFIRMAVNYDSLPMLAGPVWKSFPTHARWDSLAPRGKVRNLRGHEAAVAYREHGGEPFHYAVMSYDERGRVEALLRYTENLGFDAVYYTYNSLNKVIAVRTADPLRQYTSWYGYDGNGRVDSVWTLLSGLWEGLGVKTPHYVAAQSRPDMADIVYHYTPTGRVDTMRYDPVGVLVAYAYDHRKWLDSMVSYRSGSPLFKQLLGYDSTGQIVSQSWQHGASPLTTHHYGYDNADQLTWWHDGADTTKYLYDRVGNRLMRSKVVVTDQTTSSYTDPHGSDRLSQTVRAAGVLSAITDYAYNPDGAVTGIRRSPTTGKATADSLFYDWRDLTRQYEHHVLGAGGVTETQDWRYRYSAAGEREQKRLYLWLDSLHNPVGGKSWVYYALGGSREQLAVYHGQEQLLPACSPLFSVYFYPTEYNTFGVMYPGSMEDIASVTTRPDAAKPKGVKEFKITDHLSSTRVVVTSGSNQIYDYSPWGELLSSATTPARQGFNGREEDKESSRFSLGVRQYDGEADGGRFTSIDPKWEKLRSVSPYVYSNDNPLRYTDPSGKQAVVIMEPTAGALNATAAFYAFKNHYAAENAVVGMINSREPKKVIVQGIGEIYLGGFNMQNPKMDHSLPPAGGHNDALDAIRHAYWSAMNARDVGAKGAEAFGVTWECWGGINGEPTTEANMDIFNNHIGAMIGASNPGATNEQLLRFVMDALTKGKLQIGLSPNSIGDLKNRAIWHSMFDGSTEEKTKDKP